MKLKNQDQAIQSLRSLAISDRHSIMIEGPLGSGKSYLAREYSKLLNCHNFVSVEPKVQDICDVINQAYQTSEPVVICIENLDTGVVAAAYAVLKFLEEPLPYIYIVVTCRSMWGVPDTIVSRSSVVTLSPPTAADLHEYVHDRYPDKYLDIETSPLWPCLNSFNTIDLAVDLSESQRDYIIELPQTLKENDSVSTLMWKIQKFEDGSATPLELTIRYIIRNANAAAKAAGLRCLDDIASGRIAAHAAVAAFAFDYKYIE